MALLDTGTTFSIIPLADVIKCSLRFSAVTIILNSKRTKTYFVSEKVRLKFKGKKVIVKGEVMASHKIHILILGCPFLFNSVFDFKKREVTLKTSRGDAVTLDFVCSAAATGFSLPSDRDVPPRAE